MHAEWLRLDLEEWRKARLFEKARGLLRDGRGPMAMRDALEEVTRERRMLYLDRMAKRMMCLESGKLGPAKASGAASDAYVYYPLDTQPDNWKRRK